MDQNAKWNHRSHCIGRIATIGMEPLAIRFKIFLTYNTHPTPRCTIS